jgi:hypothetical protein
MQYNTWVTEIDDEVRADAVDGLLTWQLFCVQPIALCNMQVSSRAIPEFSSIAASSMSSIISIAVTIHMGVRQINIIQR